MMKLRNVLMPLSLASSALAVAILAGGCEKKQEPKPQATGSVGMGLNSEGGLPPAVSLSELTLHSKVQFPEDQLPDSLEVARAIAKLASAIAAGSADELKSMITPRDAAVLDLLVESGAWKRQADDVKSVRVCVINAAGEKPLQVGLGVENSLGAFLLGWEGTGDEASMIFGNLAIEPRTASTAKDLDKADLVLRALPGGLPEPKEDVRVADETKKKDDDEKPKTKPKKKSDPPPGTLTPDPF